MSKWHFAAKGPDARSLEREFLSTRLAAASLGPQVNAVGNGHDVSSELHVVSVARARISMMKLRATHRILPVAHTLAQNAAERDTSARENRIDRLYRTQAARLLRLFCRRGETQSAPDLLQETFVRYVRATSERGICPDSPESYLRQIAVNVMHNHWRASGPERAQRAALSDEPESYATDLGSELESRDMLQRVEAVMMGLKPMTRDIFIARRFHGYTRAEIAARTGLSIKAVDKHIARAIARLHRELGSDGDA